MNRISSRAALTLVAVGLISLFAAACGSSEDVPPGAKKLSFKLTDAGCLPHDAEAPAGPIEFAIENDGTSNVTEFEVLDGETILGEKENLSDGLSESFALTLEQGDTSSTARAGTTSAAPSSSPLEGLAWVGDCRDWR